MDDEVRVVPILLVGDEEVGKSTFLSRLTLGAHAHPSYSASSTDTLPPYELPKLRDIDQPFIFNIRLYNRHYRFEFYDTASPENYTLLNPDFVIICFDISQRATLGSVKTKWKAVIAEHFDRNDEKVPIMVLGLKRDLRREWTDEEQAAAEDEIQGMDGRRGGMGGAVGEWKDTGGTKSVMPQEGLRVSQELRADRYAECSALTGELCREVLEDIARTAAKTTTDAGAKGEAGCSVM